MALPRGAAELWPYKETTYHGLGVLFLPSISLIVSRYLASGWGQLISSGTGRVVPDEALQRRGGL